MTLPSRYYVEDVRPLFTDHELATSEVEHARKPWHVVDCTTFRTVSAHRTRPAAERAARRL